MFTCLGAYVDCKSACVSILGMLFFIYLLILFIYLFIYLRTSVNGCFWTLLIQSGSSNRKNRYVFRDDNQRRIENPMKYLRRIFLHYLTVNYFCKTLHIICFLGLWICLDKTKQNVVIYFTKNLDYNLCKSIFKFNFIFILLPCRETLITDSKHVPFISNLFTFAAEYI